MNAQAEKVEVFIRSLNVVIYVINGNAQTCEI